MLMTFSLMENHTLKCHSITQHTHLGIKAMAMSDFTPVADFPNINLTVSKLKREEGQDVIGVQLKHNSRGNKH